MLAIAPAGTSASPPAPLFRQRRRPLERRRRDRHQCRTCPGQQQRARRHGARGDYDAVAAVEGGLEPFATDVTAAPGASADAAVAQAARDVLVVRVPGQAAAVQTAYDAYMGSLPDGSAKEAGKAAGAAAAAGMLAMRAGDHFDDVVPYVQQTPGPGVFEPIAPTPPVDPKLAFVRPFTYDSPSQYRPRGPLELKTGRYAKDWRNCRRTGASTAPSGRPLRPRRSGSTRADLLPVQPDAS